MEALSVTIFPLLSNKEKIFSRALSICENIQMLKSIDPQFFSLHAGGAKV